MKRIFAPKGDRNQHAFRVRERQRAQEYASDDRVDRRVRSDAERQSNDDEKAEARAGAEIAKDELHIGRETGCKSSG